MTRMIQRALTVSLAILFLSLSFDTAGAQRASLTAPTGYIAFTSYQTGHPEIFMMTADGTNVRQLTRSATADLSHFAPIWSRDGQYLAYFEFSKMLGKNKLTVMKADGSSPVVLAQDEIDTRLLDPYTFLDWSPDGKWILFARQPKGKNIQGAPEYHLVQVDGSNPLTLNPDAKPSLGIVRFIEPGALLGFADKPYRITLSDKLLEATSITAPIYGAVGVSFDGKQIAWVGRDNNMLTVTDIATGQNHDVTPIPNKHWAAYRIRWSPDGNSLGLEGHDESNLVKVTGQPTPDPNSISPMVTYGVNIAEKSTVMLMMNRSGYGNVISWSPDSQFLAFDSETDGLNQIFVIRANGSGKTQITTGQNNAQPAWRPAS